MVCMTISRKILAAVTVAGLALSGTAVAQAQSSSLLTGLSSSSAPATSNLKKEREELRQALLDMWEERGHTFTDEANEEAQEAAERVAAGESLRSLGNRYQAGNPIPNVLLGAYIEEVERLPEFTDDYQIEAGLGVAGTAHTTYIVLYYPSVSQVDPGVDDLPPSGPDTI